MSKSELITAVVDGIVSTLAIVLGMVFKPAVVTEIMGIVLLWQPIVIALLINHAAERRAILRIK